MNDNTLLNVQEIVKRAKQVMKFKTDLELAQYLGVARSTLSNWMVRNSISSPPRVKTGLSRPPRIGRR